MLNPLKFLNLKKELDNNSYDLPCNNYYTISGSSELFATHESDIKPDIKNALTIMVYGPDTLKFYVNSRIVSDYNANIDESSSMFNPLYYGKYKNLNLNSLPKLIVKPGMYTEIKSTIYPKDCYLMFTIHKFYVISCSAVSENKDHRIRSLNTEIKPFLTKVIKKYRAIFS